MSTIPKVEYVSFSSYAKYILQLVEYDGNTYDVTIIVNKQGGNIDLKDAARWLECAFLKSLLELEDDLLPVGKIKKPLILGMGKMTRAYKQYIEVAQGRSKS